MSMNSEEEEIVESFFGENARASELREFKETLQTRLQIVTAEYNAMPDLDGGRAALERKIRELKEQVSVLAEEEAVSSFVEDSVRATLYRPDTGRDDLGADDDGGPY